MKKKNYVICANGLHFPDHGIPKGYVYDPDEKPDEEEVKICIEFLQRYGRPTKSIRREDMSYGLKHTVERWTRAEYGERTYISNGAFIEAARRAGYSIHPDTVSSPNCYFNMGKIREDW